MKTIAVVATETLEKQGRQFSHSLSQVDGQSAVLWTVGHYRDNESRITGRQPVIFLGPSAPAEALAETMPSAFQVHGVTCYVEGARVVILATLPASADTDALRNLTRELDQETETVLNNVAAGSAAAAVGTAAVTAGGLVALAFVPVIGIGAAGATAALYLFKRRDLQAQRRKLEVAQYRYGIARFTADHLDSWLARS